MELEGEALEGGVLGAAGHELAPALATHRGGGNNPPRAKTHPRLAMISRWAPSAEEDAGRASGPEVAMYAPTPRSLASE